MKKSIFSLILILSFVGFVSSNLYYEVNVIVKDRELFIDSIDLIYSRIELFNFYIDEDDLLELFDFEIKDYNYDFFVYGSDERLIYSEVISILDIYIIDLEDDVQEISYSDEFNFSFYFPYIEGTEKIVVEDKNKVILEYEIYKASEVSKEELRVFEKRENRFLVFIFSLLIFLVVLFLIFYLIFKKFS